MDVKIGTAPASWGIWFPSDPHQTPWQRFLDEAALAEYDWVELGPYGYLPTEPSTLKSELEQRGLRVSTGQASGCLHESSGWSALERQILGAGRLLAELGAPYLVLLDEPYIDRLTGEATGVRRLDAEGWQQLIDTVHRAADVAREEFGLQLLFEPHSATHVEYENQIDTLLAQTDPDRVSMLMDVGHIAYRGGDPVGLLKRHADRISYLHLKDLDPVVYASVEAQGIPFVKAVGMGVFCELSEGLVDFTALRDALQEVDFEGWVVVEQGMYPAPPDKPLPIARRNRQYLREIGL